MKPYDKLLTAYKSVEGRLPFKPRVALILGSGLGDFADTTEIKATIPYGEIEGFPVSTAPGHKGRFVFANVAGVPTVIMQGRVHYYEGYPMSDVVLPTRLMGLMGAKILFLTNAAGGINSAFKAGDFMLITDQISSFSPSPLIGENPEKLGVRFPDMTDIYKPALQDAIRAAAKSEGIAMQQGVYLQATGPAFESPAEVRLYGMLGADAVGMSTACEAIAANHMGLSVCGVSCISNMASGLSDAKLTSEDVNETADKVGGIFGRLVTASVKLLDKAL